MNYKLAKQLKEINPELAGELEDTGLKLAPPVLTFDPTLDELIEACGGTLRSLNKRDGVWCAESSFEERKWQGYGDTPQEAVAKLYLALHLYLRESLQNVK